MTTTTAETGAALIAAERRRQQDVERWDDTRYTLPELAEAALCYIEAALHDLDGSPRDDLDDPHPEWPWSADTYKPTWGDPVRTLVKAGALIAAEIDRLRARP